MIIVSQAKDEIINFKNMNNIYISRTGEIRACANMEDCVYVLGNYSTQERAKEVLKEIWKFYEISKRYECSNNNGITIFLEPKFAYQMPEE